MTDGPNIYRPWSAARLVRHSGCALLLVLALLGSGCGAATAKMDHDATTAASGEAGTDAAATEPFTLQIESEKQSPQRVVVWLSIATPSAWSRLPPPQDPRWTTALTLRLVDPQTTSSAETESPLPGMAGTFARVGNRLRFEPRFPLLPGSTYRARFVSHALPGLNEGAGPGESANIAVDYTVPAVDQLTPPQVIGFYPTSPTLPANQLKFYIQFSEPMQGGNVWEYFDLRDESTGEPVPSPFRHTELWSEDHRQLTLWFHPGRQKTGVNLNVEIGTILEPGRRYTLSLSPHWKSERGAPLGTAVEKSFLATERDRTQPDLQNWTVQPPRAGTRDPLRVRFPEPLDFALLHSQISVRDVGGRVVAGQVEIGDHEQHWEFIPAAPWQPGEYKLQAQHVLEDLAGNSLGRLFEVDLELPAAPSARLFERRFVIPAETE